MTETSALRRGSGRDEVIKLLNNRRLSGYRRGTSEDGHKIALVIEGGAMAGLISAASALELQQLGYTNCFDEVYGTSAGAVNAAYFVAGQSDICVRIYLEEVIAGKFMRLFRWPNQIDIDWLADNVVSEGPKRLDTAVLAKSPIELRIPVTDTTSGACRFVSNHADPIGHLIPAIKASGSNPLLTTHTERLDGNTYNDGMVRAAVASEAAKRAGNDVIVALLSHPPGRRKRFNFGAALLEQAFRIRFYARDYQTAFHARAAFYNDAMTVLEKPGPNLRTLIVEAAPGTEIERSLERRSNLLSKITDLQRTHVAAIFRAADSQQAPIY
jgi:predicted patatin/cPLA2 family phospholipase